MAARGFTKSKLARELKTTASTVGRWFEGSVPQDIRIKQLSSILGVSESWLTRGTDELTPASRNAEPSEGILREDPPDRPIKRLANDYALWDQLRMQRIDSLMGKLRYIFVSAARTDRQTDEEARRYAEFEIGEFYNTLDTLRNSRPAKIYENAD